MLKKTICLIMTMATLFGVSGQAFAADATPENIAVESGTYAILDEGASSEEYAAARSTDGVYLTTTAVNLRKSAGTSGSIIGTLSKNASVYYAGNNSKVANGMLWLYVTVYSGDYVGYSGWVANRYLTKIG